MELILENLSKNKITNEQLIQKYVNLLKQCKQIEDRHEYKIKEEKTAIQERYMNSIAFSIQVMNNRSIIKDGIGD